MIVRTRIFTTLLFLSLLLEFPLQVLAAINEGGARLVFLSNRDRRNASDRRFDVFLYDLKSLKAENLTKGMTGVVIRSDAQPRINLKKNLVVFISSQDRSFIALDLGTRVFTKVAPVAYEATSYSISPDGEALLYTERVGQTLQVFEVEIAGGTPRNLTKNNYNNFEASYSPDGTQIAFVCTSDGSNSVAVMKRNGSGQRILTNRFGDDRYPRWSPDSRKLVLSSSRSGSTDTEYDLYMIDASGANFTLFHQSKAYNALPVFSPDNSYVAWVTNARGDLHKDIVIKELPGGLLRPLTFEMNGANDHFSIGDGGRIIVFENSTPADSEIWMYDLRTKMMTNVSNHKGRDILPSMDELNQELR
jgi:Tol biopolymer transport system component